MFVQSMEGRRAIGAGGDQESTPVGFHQGEVLARAEGNSLVQDQTRSRARHATNARQNPSRQAAKVCASLFVLARPHFDRLGLLAATSVPQGLKPLSLLLCPWIAGLKPSPATRSQLS